MTHILLDAMLLAQRHIGEPLGTRRERRFRSSRSRPGAAEFTRPTRRFRRSRTNPSRLRHEQEQ